MILASTAGVKAQNHNLTSLQQIEENDLRRTDLLLYGASDQGLNLYTDLSVGHPCSRSHVNQACRHPGHTLMKINTKKNQKYGESCIAIGARFLPLAFETFGRTSDEVMNLLRNLVGMGSEAKQIPFSRLLSHWKRRLATTLQRENALFVLNTSANILYASNRYTPNQDTYILMKFSMRACTAHNYIVIYTPI